MTPLSRWRDPAVLAALGLFGLLALPLVVALPLPVARATYAETCTTIPLLALGIGVYAWRWRTARGEKRRFWSRMIAALGCWVVQQIVLIATWSSPAAHGYSALQDVFYAGVYLFLVLALDVRPHLALEPDDRGILATIRRTGTVVFVFGLLLYLVLVPATLSPPTYWASVPSFTLYIVLDLYLLVRLVPLFLRVGPGRWRATYGWMLAAAGLWLVLDPLELLAWLGFARWMQPGGAWDLPWMLPPLLLALAGLDRGRGEALDSTAGAVQPAGSVRLSSGGPLVLAAMMVPLLHFTLWGFGLFDASLHRAQESLAFALVIVLGGFIFAYQRVLESRTRQLEAERAQALARIEHQAGHDPLTGLPNRRLLDDRLQLAMAMAARRGERVAVLFFDLDDFKRINDSRGHAFGDELLQRIGERMASQIRASDTLARIGGDEFVVVAGGVESRESMMRRGEELLAKLGEPLHHQGESFAVSASLGIALYPDDGEDPVELLRLADAEMYRAKQVRNGRPASS